MFAPCLRRRACGFTLTELAIVLSVIGLILGAVWTAAANVFQRERVNDTILQFKQIADNVRALYSATNYSGSKGIPCGTQTPCTTASSDITAALISNGAIPMSMVTGSGASQVVQTPEGGTLTVLVKPGAPGTPTSLQFEILGTAIPKTCPNVLAYFAGEAADLNIAYIYYIVTGGTGTWLNPAGNALDVTSFGSCVNGGVEFNLY